MSDIQPSLISPWIIEVIFNILTFAINHEQKPDVSVPFFSVLSFMHFFFNVAQAFVLSATTLSKQHRRFTTVYEKMVKYSPF